MKTFLTRRPLVARLTRHLKRAGYRGTAHSVEGMASQFRAWSPRRAPVDADTQPGTRPVFVTGCAHSGTTIMTVLLDTHPNLRAILRDTGLFSQRKGADIYDRYHRYREQLGLKPKQRLVEKTPVHVFYVPVIERYFPDARIIVMLRDGRDVTCSLRQRHGGFESCVQQWIETARATSRNSDDPQVKVIRYEDLVHAPRPTLESVCEFLGEPFDETMLHHHLTHRGWAGLPGDQRPPAAAPDDELRAWQTGQPLFDGTGRWRVDMTPAERWYFQQQAGRLLRHFEYEIDDEWCLVPAG